MVLKTDRLLDFVERGTPGYAIGTSQMVAANDATKILPSSPVTVIVAADTKKRILVFSAAKTDSVFGEIQKIFAESHHFPHLNAVSASTSSASECEDGCNDRSKNISGVSCIDEEALLELDHADAIDRVVITVKGRFYDETFLNNVFTRFRKMGPEKLEVWCQYDEFGYDCCLFNIKGYNVDEAQEFLKLAEKLFYCKSTFHSQLVDHSGLNRFLFNHKGATANVFYLHSEMPSALLFIWQFLKRFAKVKPDLADFEICFSVEALVFPEDVVNSFIAQIRDFAEVSPAKRKTGLRIHKITLKNVAAVFWLKFGIDGIEIFRPVTFGHKNC